MNEEAQWALVWALIIGAAVATETVALKTGKPYAPLSYWLRRIPAHTKAGQVALLYGAYRLHRHLYRKGVS